ncbi:nitrite reductase small subunit NirD [Stutzerimonas chloritidismutans]|uniref:Nitrite reductase small subunit NirD n=1 Tax=Stutzerimonas chloritidismutans TaxID=203192 RepID=A0ABU9M8D7_STUCH
MSQPNAVRIDSAQSASWRALCSRRDLVANSGVVAWLEGEQVALFHLPDTEAGEQIFAISNKDPKSGANVIGRGILGQLKGDLVIASPLYKQHFRLADGSCLEYPEQQLQVWPARLNGDAVEIAAV